MILQEPPHSSPLVEIPGKNGNIRIFSASTWSIFFNSLYQQVVKSRDIQEGSGLTATRPTGGLYVGRQYFDTTLGKPVFIKSLSPAVWVDAAGTTV